jgi:TetR/AcrR family transcriptional regulator, cholesterol catabolism regulator
MARAKTASKATAAPVRPIRDGQRTAEAMREAAADLFYTHGYEATSLREVASAVGIQVGSLYNHIAGKDQLLSSIMIEVMQDLLAAMEQATEGLEDPVLRLAAAIDCHIRFHAERRRDVFIGNSELRSLSPEDRKRVVSLRKKYEESLRELVSAATAEAHGDLIDPKLQVFAIVAIGTHVSSWYLPGRGYSLDVIVDTYTTMIFRQLAISRP